MFDGEKMKRILIIAFLLIILSLVGAVIFYGISTISKLSAEVVASFVTGLIGLSGILLAQWYSKKKEISESHRPAKVEVYERFFDIVETFMADTKSSDSDLDAVDLPAGLVKELTKMSRGMVVWASPDVILAWSKFRTFSNNKNEKEPVLLVVDDLMQAIRKDLGNSNFGLKRGDVIKMYISNPSEVDDLLH
jgi:hypothetical protein